MLVLTRRENESIVITIGDEEVTVMVVGIGRHKGQPTKVRLGVQAPKHVAVDRREIHEAKKRNKAS